MRHVSVCVCCVCQRPGYLAPGAHTLMPWPRVADWPVLSRAVASLEAVSDSSACRGKGGWLERALGPRQVRGGCWFLTQGFPLIRAELLRSMAGTSLAGDLPPASAVDEAGGGGPAGHSQAAAGSRTQGVEWGQEDLEGLTRGGR
eukprot:COSAG01_NODE_4389_length_5071_cov_139.047246_1_plen_145_part_00